MTMQTNIYAKKKVRNMYKHLDEFPIWSYLNPLKPDVWERLVLPREGAQRHPLEINEGVSGEQDSINTIFNTNKIRIVCKI